MKTKLIVEKGDVEDLLGRFIVQINDNLKNSHQINWDRFGFLLEKRVSRISIIPTVDYSEEKSIPSGERKKFFLQGHFCAHSKALSEDDFIEKINRGGTEGRYYRLLTLEETLEYGKREFEYSEKQLKRPRFNG